MDTTGTPANGVKRRGFASMSPERRKELAIKGGRSVPDEKRSFAQNRDLAREAGRQGGMQTHLNKKDKA